MTAPNKYADRERIIKGLARNGAVTAEIVRSIANDFRNSTINANLKAEYDDKFGIYKTLRSGTEIIWNKPDLDLKFSIDEVIKLLVQKVENPQLTDRERYLLDISEQTKTDYVALLRRDIVGQQLTKCPLCQNDIDTQQRQKLSDIVSNILNKDMDEHVAKLRQALDQVATPNCPLPQLPPELYANDLKAALNHLGKVDNFIEELRTSISKKIESPITPIDETKMKSDLESVLQQLQDAISIIDDDVKDYNTNIKKKEDLKNELLEMNRQLAWMEHSNEINNYLLKVAQLKNIQNEYFEITKEIAEMGVSLKQLKAQKSDVSEAVTVINQSLRNIFADSHRMTIEYDPTKNCYKLKSRGKDVQPDRISEGERNIIGLAYFFASINANQEVNDIYKKPVLLMIDDPISSYDYNNKIGVITFISGQIETMKEKNEESKVILMSHDMQTIQRFAQVYHNIYNLPKKYLVPVYRLENGKVTKTTEMERSDTYKRLLHQIYDFAISNDPKEVEDLTIGNEIRRVLESYCTFNYQKGIGYMRTLARNAPGLKGDEKKDKRDKYMTFIRNSFFHTDSHSQADMEESQYDFETSYEEKRKTAQHVLMLLYYINKFHLDGYFEDEEMSIIEEWCNNDTEW